MIAALRRRRWSLAWVLLIVALAVLLAWLVSVPLLRGEPVGRDGAGVGRPAPELTATDLEGRAWSLNDTDAPLVWVNFWATSCEPCRTEMPAMQRLALAYPDDLLILGVDWGEEASAVADFADRYGVTYPILMDPGLANYYRWAGTDGLPRHYFVGEAGTMLREVIGPLEPARMVEIVEELLAEADEPGA
ncbi:MAG TPA: TlpA disulfide reductase family protein [Candidatus Limnocylindria bacterium]|nr:TlpA disulfide reductase family protein [Candidatus Limnocylindria bacterium]